MTAEMWEDYKIFKAAGLLDERYFNDYQIYEGGKLVWTRNCLEMR
jgi:hypothetical protein